MTGIGEGTASAAKGLEIIKDLPLWVLAGLTIAGSVLIFAPGIAPVAPATAGPWIIVATVLFGALAVARAAALDRANPALALGKSCPPEIPYHR